MKIHTKILLCLAIVFSGKNIVAQNSNPWPATGAVGIGTTAPVSGTLLNVKNGAVLFEGTTGYVNFGTGTAFLWNPSKGALRAGYVSHEQWFVQGLRSVAIGENVIARGNNTAAFGVETQADAYNSFVIGRYNVYSGSLTSWVGSDPLFVIGNGSGYASRSNALTVLKDGRIGIGTAIPDFKLEVRGNLEIETDNADNHIRFHDPGDAWFSMGTDRSDQNKFKINYGGTVGEAAHFTMQSNGNIGIGMNAPTEKLDIVGNIKTRSWNTAECPTCYVTYGHDGGNGVIDSYGPATGIGGALLLNYYSGKNVSVPNSFFAGKIGSGSNALAGAASSYQMHINGKVLIGNDPAPSPWDAYELQVDGNIVAKRVVVSTANWADYVFKKEYKLLGIHELEKYIQKNGHLPGIEPASELEKSGLDVEAMLKKQMEKIEELTLYIIELKKENDAIKEQLKR